MANILIVDDDLTILDMTSQVLTLAGHRTWRAASGDDALMALKGAGHFDLVITDLIMPGKPGSDLIEWVRKNRPSVPVIVMSGLLSPDSTSAIDGLTKRGVKKILFKPFHSGAFLTAVIQTLSG